MVSPKADEDDYIPITTSSGRKQHICRTCNTPMKGHNQPGILEKCLAIKAGKELIEAKPPTTPRAASLATPPASPPGANRVANWVGNAGGHFPSGRLVKDKQMPIIRHMRGPLWSPSVKAAPLPYQPPPGAPSLVPTVLVDEDGHTIPEQGSPRGPPSHAAAMAQLAASASASDDDEDEDGLGSACGSGFRTPPRRLKMPMAQMMQRAHALELCDPMLEILRVRPADLPRMQATAGQLGLCTSIVRSPWDLPKFKDEFASSTGKPGRAQKEDLWLVVGDDPGLVQRTSELQQPCQHIPGMMKDDVVVVQATYKHVFIASTVSTIMALIAVGLLL